jgi:hypothetical protein
MTNSYPIQKDLHRFSYWAVYEDNLNMAFISQGAYFGLAILIGPSNQLCLGRNVSLYRSNSQISYSSKNN